MIINPFIHGFTGETGFPDIPDDNATFDDDGGATTGWTASNATLSVTSGYLRETKGPTAGSSSSMTKSITFTGTDLDYIIYGTARCSVGTTHIGVIWILNGSKEVSIWFGSTAANSSTYSDGAVSICGTTGASTRNVVQVASGMAYNTTAITFALQFDKKFSTLNCFFFESGVWVYKGRVACDWFSSADIAVLNTSNSPNGAWVEFDRLAVCRPNMMSIGDGICGGGTGFNPDRTAGLSNHLSTWYAYSTLYPALLNTLIINKGVGSNSSANIASRIVADAVDHQPRLIFVHCSSNDESLAVSQASRTASIQDCVDEVNGGGAACILLNAMYGTEAGADNTPTDDLHDYMLDWWDNYRTSVTGIALSIDIMQAVEDIDGFQDPAITQADGIHPTTVGYEAIGDYISAAA